MSTEATRRYSVMSLDDLLGDKRCKEREVREEKGLCEDRKGREG